MLFVAVLAAQVFGRAPLHSWDTLSSMSFFHACNETGLWSERALDTITKFPFVTVEKGQAFHAPCPKGSNAPCAEVKIISQLKAIKDRNSSIATVFYMNSVLSWYFYHMDTEMHEHRRWQLNDSYTKKAVLAGGDKHFNPPKQGMLVYAHNVPEMRDYWISTCINATKTGHVDGCFSDSSQPNTHGTGKHLNAADEQAFEDGKVETMSQMTKFFGGEPGQPYTTANTGVLIGKKPDQKGINAFQIEMFQANEKQIQVLLAGVDQGYLVQAHASVNTDASKHGCNDMEAMTDVISAFLIGAGDFSFFGSGPWISPDIADIEQRYCASLFERPIGRPLANATKDKHGVWHRAFASGTKVEFDTKTNKGTIMWSAFTS